MNGVAKTPLRREPQPVRPQSLERRMSIGRLSVTEEIPAAVEKVSAQSHRILLQHHFQRGTINQLDCYGRTVQL